MKIHEFDKTKLYKIKALWQELNAHHQKQSTYFKDHYANYTFEKRIEKFEINEKLIVFLADEGGDHLGFCIATADGEKGEIAAIYIKQEYQGKNVGQQLMDKALTWLEKQGCRNIILLVAVGNEQVIDFYRKIGFAERFILMEKK